MKLTIIILAIAKMVSCSYQKNCVTVLKGRCALGFFLPFKDVQIHSRFINNQFFDISLLTWLMLSISKICSYYCLGPVVCAPNHKCVVFVYLFILLSSLQYARTFTLHHASPDTKHCLSHHRCANTTLVLCGSGRRSDGWRGGQFVVRVWCDARLSITIRRDHPRDQAGVWNCGPVDTNGVCFFRR